MPRILVVGSIFNIEYEGLGSICFTCGRAGHRKDACPHNASTSSPHQDSSPLNPPATTPAKAHTEVSSSPLDPGSKEDDRFSPWMFIEKTKKGRPPAGTTVTRALRKDGVTDVNTKNEAKLGPTNRFSIFEETKDETIRKASFNEKHGPAVAHTAKGKSAGAHASHRKKSPPMAERKELEGKNFAEKPKPQKSQFLYHLVGKKNKAPAN